jgi:histidinol phosphatase-like PHP family hydrolase
MAKTLKMDLHTHPIEALKDPMGIKGISEIKVEVASAIVKAVKQAGLSGIAITEYHNFNHSWVAVLEIMDHFRSENLIILPGAEIDYGGQQFLHIYIPEKYRRRIPFFRGKERFLILAHPGFYNPLDIAQISRIEIDAVEERSLLGNFALAESISRERNVPSTGSSDAHKLEDLGYCFTEMEMQ